jgi:hypothetical protein
MFGFADYTELRECTIAVIGAARAILIVIWSE